MFRTLRVGFPDADVTVWKNNLPIAVAKLVDDAAAKCGCRIVELHGVAHDAWIEQLAERSLVPFWVVDTDVVFFDDVSSFPVEDDHLLGRYEPRFIEPWTKTRKIDRLHTAVLYIHPDLVRRRLREWMALWHPKGFPFRPRVELYGQHFVPNDGVPIFYDTCAGTFQAVGGTRFTPAQDADFEHLHCGCYSDRIAGALGGIGAVHAAVLEDPARARGLLKDQMAYYAANAWS